MVKFRRHSGDSDSGDRSAGKRADEVRGDGGRRPAADPSAAGISAPVRELADADVVAFGPVGFAAQTLPVTEAYQTIEERLPEKADEVQPQLAWLLEHGSPAGRVYAATLLGRFDPAAAEAAWRSLAAEHDEFSTFTGCVMNRTTLADYALGRLDHR